MDYGSSRMFSNRVPGLRLLSNRSADRLWELTAGYLTSYMDEAPRKDFKDRLLNTNSKNFLSGEVYVQLPVNAREKNVHIIGSFHRPDLYHLKREVVNSNMDMETKGKLISDYIHSSETDFRECEKICDAARRSGANSVAFYFAQFPDARQDKKDESRVPISAKLTLDNIISSTEPKLNRIGITDIHAEQIQGMTNYPVDQIQCEYLFLMHWKHELGDLDNGVLLLPDAGSFKRYGKTIDEFGLNHAVISKMRKGHNESDAMHFSGISPEGKYAIIFDDMIDTGGTAIDAGKAALEKGAKGVIIYTTHGLFSTKINKEEDGSVSGFSFAEDKFKDSGIRVICSDTVPRTDEYRKEQSDWLQQFTIAPYLAELIYCNECGTSHGKQIKRAEQLAKNGTKDELSKELNKFFIYD